MTKQQFIRLMRFPGEWLELDMYPDELFFGQIALYSRGDENGAEHDRNGAFHWWLRRGPNRAELEKLLRLAALDPDPLVGADVRKHISKSKTYDTKMAQLARKLFRDK